MKVSLVFAAFVLALVDGVIGGCLETVKALQTRVESAIPTNVVKKQSSSKNGVMTYVYASSGLLPEKFQDVRCFATKLSEDGAATDFVIAVGRTDQALLTKYVVTEKKGYIELTTAAKNKEFGFTKKTHTIAFYENHIKVFIQCADTMGGTDLVGIGVDMDHAKDPTVQQELISARRFLQIFGFVSARNIPACEEDELGIFLKI